VNKRKFYKNKEKLRAYRKRDNAKYYSKTTKTSYNTGLVWTNEEIATVLFSPHTDTEIALKLGRSIAAVQIARNRNKSNADKYFEYYRKDIWDE